MDRRYVIAGNWKMYKTAGEGVVLVKDIALLVNDVWDKADIVVCPPFTGIKSVSTLIELDRLTIGLGAQDCHWEEEGAFTGAVAPRMLSDMSVGYVIIGHSERREFFGETDETVNRKVKAVLAHGMTPIMCCGENLEVRDAGDAEAFVRGQITAGLAGVSAEEAATLVIAYEPIWSIGTGRTPTPEAANDVARAIRATVGAMFGPPAAIRTRILYGGSVKPENAAMFMAEPDIDGSLVGGAALTASSFADIVHASVGK